MGQYSTFKSGGKAAALIDVLNAKELQHLLCWLQTHSIAWRIIGGGSNILVPEHGFAGIIIRLRGEFKSITSIQQNLQQTENGCTCVYAGAGCSIAGFLAWNIRNSLTGLEFLTGIPGTVGGGVRMNAGAWGKSISDTLYSVIFSDRNGNAHEVKAEDIHFSYRTMEFPADWSSHAVITGARFLLQKGDKRKIIQSCRDITRKRREKQPANFPSAGSFFKNPQGDTAGRLIEAAGLKGLQKGNAMVSEKHANFIINTGSATALDIVDLMQEVQQKVYQFSGIMLEPEVHFL